MLTVGNGVTGSAVVREYIDGAAETGEVTASALASSGARTLGSADAIGDRADDIGDRVPAATVRVRSRRCESGRCGDAAEKEAEMIVSAGLVMAGDNETAPRSDERRFLADGRQLTGAGRMTGTVEVGIDDD